MTDDSFIAMPNYYGSELARVLVISVLQITHRSGLMSENPDIRSLKQIYMLWITNGRVQTAGQSKIPIALKSIYSRTECGTTRY